MSANEQVYRDTVVHLEQVLVKHRGSSSVIGYNDEDAASKEDVAAVLKLAIAEAK